MLSGGGLPLRRHVNLPVPIRHRLAAAQCSISLNSVRSRGHRNGHPPPCAAPSPARDRPQSRLGDRSHSYASRALALGEDLPTIGRLLGHVRVGTTAKYAHLVRDAEKAAAARTGDSIGAQILPGRAEAA